MPRHVVVLDPPGGELGPLAAAFEEVCGVGSVRVVRDGEDLLQGPLDLVVLDRDLGDGDRDGRAIVTSLRAHDALVPVVLVAESGDVDAAAEAIASGANDFLVRRHRLAERVETLVRKVQRWLDVIDRNRALETENELLRSERWEMVGTSSELSEVIHAVERVAKVPRPVLVVGERGTGKELVARAIHDASGARGAFVVLNCAAVADSLLEGELFGHERGAYTGADRRSPGKFELADGGTLFLDEIGHMSMPFQQKILRVIEYGTLLRVGGTREIRVSARIVAATNADLRSKVKRGELLPDLYDRLAFEEIRVPPLRERKGDIEVLARHFLARFVREVPAFHVKRISDDALERLTQHPFPGNVRELKNVIERAVCRDTNDEIAVEDLAIDDARPSPAHGTFKERIDALERELIEDALRESGGNQALAARRLGLSYHQFRYFRAKHAGK